MARILVVLLVAFALVAGAQGHTVRLGISGAVRDTSAIPFTPRANSVNQLLDYKLVKPVLSKIISEDHGPGTILGPSAFVVQIISPAEYAVLKDLVPIDEMNRIARHPDYAVQKIKFDIVCMAKVSKGMGADKKNVYAMVVSSDGYCKYRQNIFNRYKSRGGQGGLFNPCDVFLPSVTIGYNVADMAESEGVYRGSNACSSHHILKVT